MEHVHRLLACRIFNYNGSDQYISRSSLLETVQSYFQGLSLPLIMKFCADVNRGGLKVLYPSNYKANSKDIIITEI